MRIYQTWRDYVAQVALVRDLPVLAALTRRRVVDLHVERYLELSERDDWPALAVEAGFADGEADYYDALHEATVHATRQSVTARERADD